MIHVIAQSYQHAKLVMANKKISRSRWTYVYKMEQVCGLHGVKILQFGFGVDPEFLEYLKGNLLEVTHKVQDAIRDDYHCPFCKGTRKGTTNHRTEPIGVVWDQCPCHHCRPEDYEEALNNDTP